METMRAHVFHGVGRDPISPFRLDLTVWALRRRPDNVVDRWDGQTYRRVLPLPGGFAEIAVTQSGPPETPQLRVTVGATALSPEVQQCVTTTLERLLGFRTDVAAFYPLASRDAALSSLAQRFCGMKPPRFATVFESVITAIASQQVTRTVGVLLLNRLAVSYGAAVHAGEVAAYAFPQAEDLATLHPSHLRQLGFSRQKGRAMIELARSITVEGLDLERLEKLPDDEAIERLCDLQGVGRWSAEYVLLRGLGRTHVFPGDDVGARKNLQRWLNLVKPLNYAAVHRVLAPVRRTGVLSPAVGPTGGSRIPGGRSIATTDRLQQPRQHTVSTGDHTDETRIQSWRSCKLELGSGARPRNN